MSLCDEKKIVLYPNLDQRFAKVIYSIYNIFTAFMTTHFFK